MKQDDASRPRLLGGRRLLFAFILAMLLAGSACALLYRATSGEARRSLHGTAAAVEICPSPVPLTEEKTYQELKTDIGGCVTLPTLGLSLRLPDELRTQRLIVREGPPLDTTMPPTAPSLYFTTNALRRSFPTCNGVDHWLGVMSRYEGPSDTMHHEHHHFHGSTALDYPGFHVVFTVPHDSCVAATPGYLDIDPTGMTTETTAARLLWDAMTYAQPAGR